MMSITTSKTLLSVENLHLIFNTDVHRPWTWREAFTRAVHNPASAFSATKNHLHLLKDLSFEISSGERVALLGVNGTGKTSLCRCIAGIYRPTLGKIQTRGVVRAIFDTGVGIHPELTGRENAFLLAQFMYPFERDQHEEMVSEALEFSELGDFIDVPFKVYSNGMMARLCLSMISCRPGDLLILDEVFDGADTFFKEKIAKRILHMIEKSGAVIFVSHSADQIEQVCNRLILIRDGQIAYDGDVKEGLRVYAESKSGRFGVLSSHDHTL